MTAILIFAAKVIITLLVIPLACRIAAIAFRLGNDEYNQTIQHRRK